MRTQLYAHNKVAYQKVKKAFETSDRTCVVHPTGTGKSYMIAAICEGYKKVLILGPNIFVLNQVHDVLQWRKEGVDYMTYSLLVYREEVPTGYDLICLDEFHRAGAPEWGVAVDRLLEANPQAKVLGTTATPIRFLDENRDMADELFNGNIASYITLKDAFDRNILAVPRFVTGLFEFDKVTADIEERIKKSKRLKKDEKKERLTRVSNLRLEWERSQGMPQIIRKHIDKDAKRIIVFCGSIEKLKDMEETVREWFYKAGIKVAHIYQVHAYMSDGELKAAMDGFESDTEEGVKLMLSVNMLNEGVHIPRVNAVILLRTTASKIIYLQQIGRCLTAEKKDKPIILDMVDNITTTNLVHDIREGFDWYEHQKLQEEKSKEYEPKNFVVYDYTLGIRQAIEKLVPEDRCGIPLEKRLAIITSFVEKENRLPKVAEIEIYRHWRYLRMFAPDNETVIDLRKKYGRTLSNDEDLIWLREFTERNGRLPLIKKDGEDGKRFDRLIHRLKLKSNTQIQCIIDDFKTKGIDRVKKELKSFINTERRFPSAATNATNKEHTLRMSFYRYRKVLMQDPEIAAAYDISKNDCINHHKGDEKYKEWLEEIRAFEKKEARLPRKRDGDIYKHWSSLYTNRREWVKTLLEKYWKKRCTNSEMVEKKVGEIEIFANTHFRLPYITRSNEMVLARRWHQLKRHYPEHPRVTALKERFPLQNKK